MGRGKLNITPEEKEQRKKEQMRKYQQSERGRQKMKEAQDRYEKSEKGRQTREMYKKNIGKLKYSV